MQTKLLKFLIILISGTFLIPLTSFAIDTSFEGQGGYSPTQESFNPEAIALLIQDFNPWYGKNTHDGLNELNVPHDVINSPHLGTWDLSKYKFIFYASAQDNNYYLNLKNNLEKISNFVSNGGLLIAHSCDGGWDGTGDWRGFSILPGGVTHLMGWDGLKYLSQFIRITEPEHLIVKSDEFTLTDGYLSEWSFSTHGIFTNFLNNPNIKNPKVVMESNEGDGGDGPTYIDYNYGAGKVLATMQTVEWGYFNGSKWVIGDDRPELLRNEIRFAKKWKKEFWVEAKEDGSCIYDEDINKNPDETKPLKCLPNGWILKRLTENGKPIEKEINGIKWWKVIDVTDGLSGWMKKSSLNYDETKQIEWKKKTEKLDPSKNPEEGGTVPTILEAVNHYYNNREGIPSDFRFTEDLYQGMTTSSVKYLQMILKEEGTFPKDQICTDYFGPITKQAVIDFQIDYGLEDTGIIDNSTRILLNQFLDQGRYDDLIIQSPLFYISNERENYLSIFRDTDFPMGLILTVAAQETGPYRNWNNKYVSCDCGRGILQITANKNVGWASRIECYFDGIKCLPFLHDLRKLPPKRNWEDYSRECCDKENCEEMSRCPWEEVSTCRHTTTCKCRHYTNTSQGIYANIKDGLRNLQFMWDWTKTNYRATCCENGICDENKKLYCCNKKWEKECIEYDESKCSETSSTIITCEDARQMSTVQRYNTGTGNKKFTDYIGENATTGTGVAYHLKRLGDNDHFATSGEQYASSTLAEKLIYASNNAQIIQLMSPGNLQVYDSQGRVTGLVNGEVKEEIPSSLYDELHKTVVIIFPADLYRYEVVGTEEGKYKLNVENTEGGEEISFVAIDIPISTSSVHQYQIDWQKLSEGEKGVTAKIDLEGDGIFDQIVLVGKEFHIEKTLLFYQGDTSGYFSDTINLKAVLTDENGNGIGNKEIVFTIGNQVATSTTNENGIATTSIILNQIPGNYTLEVKFPGDDNYLVSKDSKPFEILKEGVVISIPDKEGFFDDLVTLEAKVLDDDGETLLHGPYQVEFKVNGEIVGEAQIDETGKVKIDWKVSFIPKEVIETYPIIVTFAGNEYYNSAEGQGQFTLKSAKWLKQDAIFELEKAKTGDKRINQKIDQIIKHIQNSLNDSLWLDASHLVFFQKDCFDPKMIEINFDGLDFEKLFEFKSDKMEQDIKITFKGKCLRPKLGIRAFHEEYIATKLMLEELKEKPRIPEELKNVFKEVIGKLVKADTLLAKVSIFDAKNTPVRNPKLQRIVEKQIKKAEEELTKAETELAKNQPDKAIMRLAKSWLHSQLAIKFAKLKGSHF